MIGLMTLWFGPLVDMRPDYGYFYLCPACYRTHIKPHVDRVHGRLAELHPLTRHLGLHPEPLEDETDSPAPDDAWPNRTRASIPAGGSGGAR
jgi:hypothetical protein